MKAVWAHEATLKEQAKKMNVESLRSNAKEGESAEFKIAKVTLKKCDIKQIQSLGRYYQCCAVDCYLDTVCCHSIYCLFHRQEPHNPNYRPDAIILT